VISRAAEGKEIITSRSALEGLCAGTHLFSERRFRYNEARSGWSYRDEGPPRVLGDGSKHTRVDRAAVAWDSHDPPSLWLGLFPSDLASFRIGPVVLFDDDACELQYEGADVLNVSEAPFIRLYRAFGAPVLSANRAMSVWCRLGRFG